MIMACTLRNMVVVRRKMRTDVLQTAQPGTFATQQTTVLLLDFRSIAFESITSF